MTDKWPDIGKENTPGKPVDQLFAQIWAPLVTDALTARDPGWHREPRPPLTRWQRLRRRVKSQIDDTRYRLGHWIAGVPLEGDDD